LLYDIAKRHTSEKTAMRAVLLLLIAPNMIFLSGVYTEALFLLLCLLTFWFWNAISSRWQSARRVSPASRDRWVWHCIWRWCAGRGNPLPSPRKAGVPTSHERAHTLCHLGFSRICRCWYWLVMCCS
jgi:hypothetical protein